MMTLLWTLTTFISYGIISVRCRVPELCNSPKASVVDCYDEQGVDLGQPATYILRNELFLPACSIEKITNLTQCYDTVLDTCPAYRDDGPDLMSKKAFLAFIVGMCVNKIAYVKGMECLGDERNSVIEYANKYCIPKDLYDMNVWDAYIQMGDWTWDKWCRMMITGIQCSVDKIQRFGCSGSFQNYLIYSSFVRLPVECYTNSSDFQWLTMYDTIPETLELHEPSGIVPLSYSYLTLLAIIILYILVIHN